MSLADVIAHSSNIGIAHVALGLGKNPYYRTIRTFGFGQKSGLDLEGESNGLLRDVNSWSALTLPTMAFGQEVGVTVLQMARGYAAIAAGGVLPTPHLVSAIRRSDGRVERRAPAPGTRVLKEPTAAILRSYLTRVVENGTGRLSAIPGFTVAGKTGTAQKAAPGGGYSHDRFIASFIGFVPAEAPRVVIAVVIDEPKGKIYGGDVAAPVFSSLGAETLRILREAARDGTGRVTPTFLSADLTSLRQATIGPVLGADVVPASLKERRPAEESGAPRGVLGEVPDLVGMSGRDAVRALSRAGLSARLAGSGFVVSQEPAPRTPADPGSVCSVVLSLDPPAGRGEDTP
jgi:cell division protein FtsI (penicillin-binding protein 3)